VAPLIWLLWERFGRASLLASRDLQGTNGSPGAPGSPSREWLLFLVRTTAVLLVVTLPMALWDWHGFVKSAVLLQLKQPLRDDALSFLTWYYWHVDKDVAKSLGWVAYAAVVPMIALALWRFPRGGGGFAAGIGLVYLAFYAFNRQAFCNYYVFVIGAFCIGAAAMTPESATAEAEAR